MNTVWNRFALAVVVQIEIIVVQIKTILFVRTVRSTEEALKLWMKGQAMGK